MSALGQKQTSEHVRVMSALPPKADIVDAMRKVRFVPKADMVAFPNRRPLYSRKQTSELGPVTNSSSLAMFAAIRRASSLLSSLAGAFRH